MLAFEFGIVVCHVTLTCDLGTVVSMPYFGFVVSMPYFGFVVSMSYFGIVVIMPYFDIVVSMVGRPGRVDPFFFCASHRRHV